MEDIRTPGILDNGFNADLLTEEYKKRSYLKIVSTQELKIIVDTIQHVIDTSCKYKDVNKVDKRFQRILNSNIQENAMEHNGFKRKSNPIWTVDGTYQPGSDFIAPNGENAEAKVYFSLANMWEYAKAAEIDITVFHQGTTLVCCYIITEKNHWHWLAKENSQWVEVPVTHNLPERLPLCSCWLRTPTELIIYSNKNNA